METGNKRLARLIDTALFESKMTATEVASHLGVSSASISKWRRTGNVSKDNLSALSNLLNRDFFSELYGTGNVDFFITRKKGIPLITTNQIKGYIEKGEIETDEYLPRLPGMSHKLFAIRVEDDSMTAPFPGSRTYPEGSIIYVDPDAVASSGKRVVACVNGKVTFKTFREEPQQNFLQSINPQYPMITMDDESYIIGVVVYAIIPE